MDITCLVDNSVQCGSQLFGEHGLSFLIETEAGRLLLDTGQSGTVLQHNMDVLEIDPRSIDALAISHAHYDHTGGLPILLEQTTPGLRLFANSTLFSERFSRSEKTVRSIGLSLSSDELSSKAELHLDGSPQEIFPGVWTTGEIIHRPYPMGRSPQHVVQKADGWVPDPYRDDLSLVLESGPEVILLCGCCHAGLLNTLAHVEGRFGRPVGAIIGGTHLAKADAAFLGQVVDVLQGMDRLRHVYLSHCSGENAVHALLNALGSEVVRPCPAGTQIEVG